MTILDRTAAIDGQLFLLLLRSPEHRWHDLPDDAGDEETSAHADLIEALQREGRLVYCSPLTHPAEGALVEARSGEVVVRPENIDNEPIAGFYIVRCASRDQAIEIASRIPDAANAPVLVRALLNLSAVGSPLAEVSPGS